MVGTHCTMYMIPATFAGELGMVLGSDECSVLGAGFSLFTVGREGGHSPDWPFSRSLLSSQTCASLHTVSVPLSFPRLMGD